MINQVKQYQTGNIFFKSHNRTEQSFMIRSVPCFRQNLNELRLCCGPVSLSNSIVGLANNGYPDLFQGKTQRELVDELITLTNTNTKKNGVLVGDLCKGMENYIIQNGYKVKNIEYRGYWPCDEKYKKSDELPDMDWITEKLKPNNIVILNYGYYKKNLDRLNHTKFNHEGNHYVSLVGYKKSGNEVELITRDPQAYILTDTRHKTTQLKEGRIYPSSQAREVTGYEGTPEAKGFYQLEEPFDSGTIILDGVVVLEMF